MKKPDQTGFATIEAVLIIVVVAILGYTGWFVWHAKQNTDKTLSNTANSQPALQKAAKKGESEAVKSSQKYLEIKEWKVKFPYEGEDTLSYKFRDSEQKYAAVISKTLVDKYHSCDDIGVGVIARNLPSDAYYEGTIEDAVQKNPSLFTKLGDYYFSFSHNQASCITNPSAQSAIDESTADAFIKAIVPKVVAE